MASILIIEDEKPILDAYSFVLSKKGHTVHMASGAEAGLQLALDKRPDIILLDMLMPGTSGLDLLRELDAPKRLPATKVVVLSNAESPNVRAEALKLGAERYLLKVELTPYQIEAVVNELLQPAS